MMESYNVHIINHSGLDLVNSEIRPFYGSSASLIPGVITNGSSVDITINYEAPDKDFWKAHSWVGFVLKSSSYPSDLGLYVYQGSKLNVDLRSIASMTDVSGVSVAKVVSVTKSSNPSDDALLYSNIVIELLPVTGVSILED